MKQFILLFRADYNDIASTSKEEMHERNSRWMDWIDRLVANDRLAEGGNHLTSKGKVLKSNERVTNGPFREKKESVLGYILILATSFDEAIDLAKNCPILAGEGTSVEVREIGVL